MQILQNQCTCSFNTLTSLLSLFAICGEAKTEEKMLWVNNDDLHFFSSYLSFHDVEKSNSEFRMKIFFFSNCQNLSLKKEILIFLFDLFLFVINYTNKSQSKSLNGITLIEKLISLNQMITIKESHSKWTFFSLAQFEKVPLIVITLEQRLTNTVGTALWDHG